MYLPIILGCWLSSFDCSAPTELVPTRTLSDCLIRIEQVDRALRKVKMRLIEGACVAIDLEPEA